MMTPMTTSPFYPFPDNPYRDEEFPKVTIIIPTVNAAQLISITLNSVLSQDYPDFEVIIIDSSTDFTIKNIKYYQSDKVRIYSVSKCSRFQMLNRGLSQAKGEYVNVLYPGDYYISKDTLKIMMTLAFSYQKPELVFCGTYLREKGQDPKMMYRDYNVENLRIGQQPTSLSGCWFRIETLRRLGKFNPEYRWRGGFDLMCRFMFDPRTRFASINRILIDLDLGKVTRRMVLAHFWETGKTVYRYFGIWALLRWFFVQKDSRRFLTLCWRRVKVAFSGTKL